MVYKIELPLLKLNVELCQNKYLYVNMQEVCVILRLQLLSYFQIKFNYLFSKTFYNNVNVIMSTIIKNLITAIFKLY